MRRSDSDPLTISWRALNPYLRMIYAWANAGLGVLFHDDEGGEIVLLERVHKFDRATSRDRAASNHEYILSFWSLCSVDPSWLPPVPYPLENPVSHSLQIACLYWYISGHTPPPGSVTTTTWTTKKTSTTKTYEETVTVVHSPPPSPTKKSIQYEARKPYAQPSTPSTSRVKAEIQSPPPLVNSPDAYTPFTTS